MGITGVLHVNMNCVDFEKSKAFYEMLGFRVLHQFPEGDYSSVSPGLGVQGARLKGALLTIGGANLPPYLDLLQWTEPTSGRPERGGATELGFRRLALTTERLDEDIERLRNAGVTFYADPIELEGPRGKARFICFEDPDGNLLQLVGA